MTVYDVSARRGEENRGRKRMAAKDAQVWIGELQAAGWNDISIVERNTGHLISPHELEQRARSETSDGAGQTGLP